MKEYWEEYGEWNKMQLVSIAYAKTKQKNYDIKTKPPEFIYMFVKILLILYLKFLNSTLAPELYQCKH